MEFPTVIGLVTNVSGTEGYDSNGADFDMLRDAIGVAGLGQALLDLPELTVFAPVDAAFVSLAQRLGYDGDDEAGSLGHIVDALTLLGAGNPVPVLQDILSYHVSAVTYPALSISDGGTADTLLDADVTIRYAPGRIEDADSGSPDSLFLSGTGLNPLGVENGLVYVMSEVLIPLDLGALLSTPDTDFIIGDDSRELINTNEGDDFIYAKGGNDRVYAGEGQDLVLGGTGRDAIFGQSGNDILKGQEGNDRLWGGRGADTIEGGAGNDLLIGGRGSDTFVFTNGSDTDRIIGFRSGRDVIDLSGYEGITGIDDLDINWGFLRTEIELQGDDSIDLIGVWAWNIDESDFIFAEPEVI